MTLSRDHVITALRTFIQQRPGLDFRNYCSGYQDKDGRAAYFSEVRSITKDLHDARELLRAVELSSIQVETLSESFRAFSGRLSISETADGRAKLDYCAGQYWPTEYRKAVCAVAAQALWDHCRDSFAASAKPGESPGDAIRRRFRQQYGRRIARRWFD